MAVPCFLFFGEAPWSSAGEVVLWREAPFEGDAATAEPFRLGHPSPKWRSDLCRLEKGAKKKIGRQKLEALSPSEQDS